MQTIADVKILDRYLDTFLKKVLSEKGIYELKSICNCILNQEEVHELDAYAKELLALSLEKKVMLSVEKNRQATHTSSYWEHFKTSSPLTKRKNTTLTKYLDLVVRDLYHSFPKKEPFLEIKTFYDQEILKASKSFFNKLFTLPNGQKVSVKDLKIAIDETLKGKKIQQLEYKVRKTNTKLKNIKYIATLTTMIAAATFSYKVKDVATKESDAEWSSQEDVEGFYDLLKKDAMANISFPSSNIDVKQDIIFVGYDNMCPIEYQQYMYEMAKKYDIPFNVFMTIVDNETNGLFNANGVISETNDYGFSQINECNHEIIEKELGYTPEDLLNDPYKNIEAAAFLIKRGYLQFPQDYETRSVDNIFGVYNGWINWKEKEGAVIYAQKAMEKYNTIYNKEEEELFQTVFSFETERKR